MGNRDSVLLGRDPGRVGIPDQHRRPSGILGDEGGFACAVLPRHAEHPDYGCYDDDGRSNLDFAHLCGGHIRSSVGWEDSRPPRIEAALVFLLCRHRAARTGVGFPQRPMARRCSGGLCVFALGIQPVENSLIAVFTPPRWRSTGYGLGSILISGWGHWRSTW